MKKVLVAEDESAIREFIIINLRRGGYDVIEACDGAEALEKYGSQPIEVDESAIWELRRISTL